MLVPLMVSCATPSKSDLDEEVRRLCAIDGGIKVYETTVPPRGQVDANGNLRITAKEYATVRDEYYFDSDTLYYRKGNPEMWRTEYRIVRVRDKKVMGTSVIYSRRGGDLRIPSPMHESLLMPCDRQSAKP